MNSQLRFTAWFKDTAADADEHDVVSQPVVGWRDSDGAAMVLDRTAGRVVAAAEQPGFTEIETVADEQPLGVVPGAPGGGCASPARARFPRPTIRWRSSCTPRTSCRW